jgi:hypothetical protein
MSKKVEKKFMYADKITHNVNMYALDFYFF